MTKFLWFAATISTAFVAGSRIGGLAPSGILKLLLGFLCTIGVGWASVALARWTGVID